MTPAPKDLNVDQIVTEGSLAVRLKTS